jgi:hypothetical protein
LKKLRSAKKHYQKLQTEREGLRATIPDERSIDSASAISMASFSQDSSYILEVHQRKTLKPLAASNTNSWPGQPINSTKTSKKGFSVSRDHSLVSTLPHLGATKQNQATTGYEEEEFQFNKTNTAKELNATGTQPLRERRALGQLVSLRARQEALRDFVDQCARSCDKRPWSKTSKR